MAEFGILEAAPLKGPPPRRVGKGRSRQRLRGERDAAGAFPNPPVMCARRPETHDVSSSIVDGTR